MKRAIAGFIGMTLLWCHVVFAGVVVDVEQRQGGGTVAERVTGRLLLDVDRLKMVADVGNPGEPSLIYQADKQRLLVIDHSRESWMQIDAAMMQEVVGQMEGLQEQMQQALAQLPPEQRQAAEEIMRQRMPPGISGDAARSVSFEVARTGREEKHQGKPCRAYEVRLDGELRTVIWATDWKNVNVSSDDFNVFRDMAAFLGGLVQSLPMIAEGGSLPMFPGLDEVDGFPMLIQDYEDGVLSSETFFKNPRRQKFDSKEFEPPAGYKAESMQDLMGRGDRG